MRRAPFPTSAAEVHSAWLRLLQAVLQLAGDASWEGLWPVQKDFRGLGFRVFGVGAFFCVCPFLVVEGCWKGSSTVLSGLRAETLRLRCCPRKGFPLSAKRCESVHTDRAWHRGRLNFWLQSTDQASDSPNIF